MLRTVSKIIEPQAVTEGAGVHLRRSIGTESLDYLDPFLLLDHLASKKCGRLSGGVSAASSSRD